MKRRSSSGSDQRGVVLLPSSFGPGTGPLQDLRATQVCGAALRSLLLLLVLASALALGTQESLEQKVKAAYLFHFLQFVQWPEDSMPGDNPYCLCVWADDAMLHALERSVEGKTVGGRTVIARRVEGPQQAKSCHVLFLGALSSGALSHALTALHTDPILTVGDSPGFADAGGIVAFHIREGRVRFEISLESAKKSRLRVSSQLMKLSRAVAE